MARRSGKKIACGSCFSRRQRAAKRIEMLPIVASPANPNPNPNLSPSPLNPSKNHGNSAPAKAGKKKTGSRLWMRFDRTGNSDVVEWDKSAILKRVSIPARDLRILGPVFSQSSNILARDKAMVVNLEFIKAIVTADEVLLLDPLSQEVIPFVDQLKQQLSSKSPFRIHETGHEAVQAKGLSLTGGQWLAANEAAEGETELPFEFQILEIALESVCSYLDSNVADLERDAYPILDELAMNVSTKNLERVRSLKSNLTRLLARVQKVRDEIEHLLDDNEDMAHLYLTRKQMQCQQFEALMASAASNNIVVPAVPHMSRLNSNAHGSASIVTSIYSDDNDVEDLEMLLEAYFMQLDGTRNKILSVREYIDDTEDYVNIQLDNQRNELIQLQLILTIASFAIAINTLIVGIFAMNIPCNLYNVQNFFEPFVGGTSAGCFLIFLLMLGYARWKKLLGP
ncbi:magnesium transporter protein [Dioscorea alata]|uniref:Magnesium transporter protein n=1 Tax=Dioscorea alata TaxID=55571 RepID=A0ACB7VD53_DIOAL|nr:magnesium transporter protein [Dioscorea alata]